MIEKEKEKRLKEQEIEKEAEFFISRKRTKDDEIVKMKSEENHFFIKKVKAEPDE